MRKRYLATLIVAVVTAIRSTGCISSYSSSSNMPTINFAYHTYSPETTKPTEPVILKDGKTLLRIGSTTAKCETDYNVCHVDVS